MSNLSETNNCNFLLGNYISKMETDFVHIYVIELRIIRTFSVSNFTNFIALMLEIFFGYSFEDDKRPSLVY